MEWFNELIIKVSFIVMEVGETLMSDSELDSWQVALGIDIQNTGENLFAFGYNESGLEVQDALDYSEDEWPSSAMSERQLNARRDAPEDSFYYQTNGGCYVN